MGGCLSKVGVAAACGRQQRPAAPRARVLTQDASPRRLGRAAKATAAPQRLPPPRRRRRCPQLQVYRQQRRHPAVMHPAARAPAARQ